MEKNRRDDHDQVQHIYQKARPILALLKNMLSITICYFQGTICTLPAGHDLPSPIASGQGLKTGHVEISAAVRGAR
ncbi:MAG: hypothetical protein HRF40_03395 [Nitrososphaera sp.]